ncbi:MAG: MSMEG_0565 family glycosyltransferase [Anaerolineales bacterium]|nr:MSMEG_0565 family glycosyltransferase [Anaerolineales bacterium]
MSKIENRKSEIQNPKSLRIALFTYSTKPRGGVVHTLALAEHLQALGHRVHIYALGKDERSAFFRPTPAPFTLIPAGSPDDDEPLDERIQRYIQTYYEFLTHHRPGPFDLYHAQDCISANALWRLREAGLIPRFVRTIHHIDDFVSPVLIDCQNHSIYRPDFRLVVSRTWQERLAQEFGVESTVIHNGVELSRFQPASQATRAEARAKLGLAEQWVFLNIGGIEPRKNSLRLLRAFQTVRQALAAQGQAAVLLMAGGDTLLDYAPYRAEFFQALKQSDLRVDRDIFLLGVAPDDLIPVLYQAADGLAFPSVKEGWGLVALEAMAAGVPVLASDLPVFREYLHSEENALLVDPLDEAAIAAGLLRLVQDGSLRRRLAAAGPATAKMFSWAATAQAHANYYQTILANLPEFQLGVNDAAKR